MPSRRAQRSSADERGASQNASSESSRAAAGQSARDARNQAPARRNAASAARAPVPANDDMPSIGGLVYALQQKPSRSPFMVAGIASVVWAILGTVVGVSMLSKYGGEINGFVDFFASPVMLGTVAGTVVPIAMFWFLAYLIWRAQELRMMSSAMTEVAVRLAEPDKMAEQSVASLGQTVRRQVAAMNDAISRALGRAGELEALVHNEVTALERSYSENEHRIRSLINELASEREALANNSARVSEALRGIGGDVRREIAAASEEATQSLAQATNSLSDQITARAQKITTAVTEAGDAVDAKLAERGAQVNEQLTKHSAKTVDNIHQQSLQVTTAIQQASDRASAAISAKSNSLVHSVMSMSERVAQEIPALLDRLGGEQQRLNSIISDATTNLSALENALSEKTKALDSSLNDKTKVLQGVLAEHSQAIDSSLSERTRALEALLGQRAKEFHNTIGAGTKQIEDSIVSRAQALEEALSRQSGTIRDTLDQHAQTMEQSLSRQAAYIERSVGQSSENIERAVSELAERTGASSEALEAQAETLRQMSSGMLNQIQSLTKRFEEQGATIMKSAKALEVSNTKVDSVMEQRQAQLGKLIESIGKRASELDKMMHNYSSMLEESLSRAENRARNVTEMLAQDSAEKSQSAVREIEKLRSETQAQTFEAIEELKSRFSALSEQIGEQLNTLTSRFSETSETVKDTTRRASMDLETTNSELRRQAKAIPETTRESATAMRKALQDQLAALDSLSDIANRHRYSAAVSRSEEQAPRSGGERPAPVRKDSGDYRSAPAQPPAARQRGREDDAWPTQRSASAQLPKRRTWDEEATQGGRRNRPGSRPDDDFSALTAGLIERLEGKPRQQRDMDERFGAEEEVSARETRDSGSARQPAPPEPQDDETAAKPAGEWSLGDLLARASEAEEDDALSFDNDGFGADERFGGDDQSYGRPPQMAPDPAPRQEKPAPEADRADFNMKDIADAVDQDTVVEVWKRYHRGDRSVISRDVYNRQGQSTFDQVQRRYRNDSAFRHIADRYMADFEKVLKDASQAGQDSKALQNYLVSETGKIYLMLAHASGRLD
ncbi:hypothetical protein [Dichotomicrobium thermohalophilum]|nr:hypothetical protein [Dichotomicrobium thermohalophilum]